MRLCLPITWPPEKGGELRSPSRSYRKVSKKNFELRRERAGVKRAGDFFFLGDTKNPLGGRGEFESSHMGKIPSRPP